MTEVVYGKKLFAAVIGNNGALINNPRYEELVRAIVLTAVKDYKRYLRKLNNPVFAMCLNWPQEYIDEYLRLANGRYEKRKEEVERFFQSGWFTELTGLDGKILMEKIRKEVEGEQQSNREQG